MPNVFVIRPFGKKPNNAGKMVDFDKVSRELIEPAVEAAKLTVGDALDVEEAGNIREDMFALLIEADLVICDVTIHNPNVFYELGIRHALRKKYNIMIKQEGFGDKTPFDLETDRYISYGMKDLPEARRKLTEVIKATITGNRVTDSPIFQMVPALQEVDPLAMQLLPADFEEEVERAFNAESKGWLRLLAQELTAYDRRFQWAGLQLVAVTQWRLKDYEDARKNLEQIRGFYADHIATNLALANVCERLYREKEQPDLLKVSELRINRVLANEHLTPENRSEALALQGRNQKTLWRQKFKRLLSVAERRQAAMNKALRDCYAAYRDAFYVDLNKFYPGLNALQMGTIFLDLSKDDSSLWQDSFPDNDKAEEERKKIAKEVENLKILVSTSIEIGLKQMNQNDPDYTWAKVSQADFMFLEKQAEQNKRRVIRQYEDIALRNKSFTWDATRGQLQLFADLDIKADLAKAVIATIDNRQEPSEDKPVRLILFAGHRVDEPGRAVPRFPAEREDNASQLIRDALRKKLDPDYQLVGLASAAPGADIIFHEVCNELNIPSTLCLPMPAGDYSREAFKDLDSWNARFLNLVREREKTHRVLELSDRAELPAWLSGAKTDFWERGNRWMVKMALTWGAESVTLIALWDNKDEGDGPGGTAHLVHEARNAGGIYVETIHAGWLLV